MLRRSSTALIPIILAGLYIGSVPACATVVDDSLPVDLEDGSTLTSTGGTTGTSGPTSSTASGTSNVNSTTSSTTNTSAGSTSTTTNSNTTSSTSTSATTGTSTSSTSSTVGGTGGMGGMGGMGGTTGTGGMSSTGMSGAGGSMGGATSMTNTVNTVNTATTSSTASCPDPRVPAEHTVPNGSSGAFDTEEAVCYRVDFLPGDFAGWGCSNMADRSVTVNGTPLECGEMPLPAAMDGSYFFEFSEGGNVSASFYWFNWR